MTLPSDHFHDTPLKWENKYEKTLTIRRREKYVQRTGILKIDEIVAAKTVWVTNPTFFDILGFAKETKKNTYHVTKI